MLWQNFKLLKIEFITIFYNYFMTTLKLNKQKMCCHEITKLNL